MLENKDVSKPKFCEWI